MSALGRTALPALCLVLALGLASPGAVAQSPGRFAVQAGGYTNHAGIAKIFWLQAVQTSAGNPAASGGAYMIQADTTHVFGDFSLMASVACLKVEGSRATVGLQPYWGLGTVQGRLGGMFYVVVEAGTGPGGGDLLDNGGFEGGAPNCDTVIGVPGGGTPILSGQVIITTVP